MEKQEQNKFKLINDNQKDDLYEENDSDEFVILEKENEKKISKKHKIRKRNMIAGATMLFSSVFLVGFGLFWQWDISIMAITDALWFAFAIEFAVAWSMFVYNHNIFSPIIHGAKTFGLMLVGKRPKEDYYHYMKNIQDNPVPAFYYIVVFISSGVLLIPSIILLIILL